MVKKLMDYKSSLENIIRILFLVMLAAPRSVIWFVARIYWSTFSNSLSSELAHMISNRFLLVYWFSRHSFCTWNLYEFHLLKTAQELRQFIRVWVQLLCHWWLIRQRFSIPFFLFHFPFCWPSYPTFVSFFPMILVLISFPSCWTYKQIKRWISKSKESLN